MAKKYYKQEKYYQEIDLDFLYCKANNLKEIKTELLKKWDFYFDRVELFLKQKKLEKVSISIDTDYVIGEYYNSDKNILKLIVIGERPMTAKEKAKAKEKEVKEKAKKAKAKEDKELKERLEFERLKKKFGE